MEGTKILEMQCRGTLRRKGRGTCRRWWRELGRPSPAPACGPGAADAYNRTNGKSHRAGRASEGVVVPLEGTGQQNPARWEGPLLRLCLWNREESVHG